MSNPYAGDPIDYLRNYDRGTDLQAAALQNQAKNASDLMMFGVKEKNDASNDYYRMLTKKQELTDKALEAATKAQLERDKLTQKTTTDAMKESNKFRIAQFEDETKRYAADAENKARSLVGSNKALQAHLEIFKAANHNVDGELKPIQAAMKHLDELGIPADDPSYSKLTERYNTILQKQRDNVKILDPVFASQPAQAQSPYAQPQPVPAPAPSAASQAIPEIPKPPVFNNVDPAIVQKKREKANLYRQQGKTPQEILQLLNQEFPN